MQKRILLLSLTLLASCGCIKRVERLTILPDGSARLATRFEGDPADIRQGDAAPTAASGWRVTERTEVDKEGEETLIREATTDVAAGEQLPSSYASLDGRERDISLSFPTTVTIEKTAAGTYYHFQRVYRARAFHFAHYFDSLAESSDAFKTLKQKQADELTEQDYRSLVDIMSRADRQKIGEFIEHTWRHLEDRVGQLGLLQARQAALGLYAEPELTEKAVQMMLTEDSAGFDDLEASFRARQLKAMRAALREAGVAPSTISEFVETYQLLRDTFEVTEDLGDEEWIVALDLPGRLVAHNSPDPLLGLTDRRTDRDGDVEITLSHHDGSTGAYQSGPVDVAWKFDGDALRDRDVVLLATSFLADEED